VSIQKNGSNIPDFVSVSFSKRKKEESCLEGKEYLRSKFPSYFKRNQTSSNSTLFRPLIMEPSSGSESKQTGGTDSAWRLGGPIHAERHVRIICVGAGASGLLFAYKLQKHFQNFTLTIYEKNPEISGTWFENKYENTILHVGFHG